MNRFVRRLWMPAMLLAAGIGAANAATVPGRIAGVVLDAEDSTKICALLIINGNYQTYSCMGTSGRPFTLDYEYAPDSDDASANTLLLFADNYKNEAVKIAQPDADILVQMRKADPQPLVDSLVGQWSLWYLDGALIADLPKPTACYQGWCPPFEIAKDDGATVEGHYKWLGPHGFGRVMRFRATYMDSQTLSWTIVGGSFIGNVDCTDTGTMRIDGHNHLVSTNETNTNCWWKGTQQWVRYNR